MLCTWFDTMDMNFLVKVAANRSNPLVGIKTKEIKEEKKTLPLSTHNCIKGSHGHYTQASKMVYPLQTQFMPKCFVHSFETAKVYEQWRKRCMTYSYSPLHSEYQPGPWKLLFCKLSQVDDLFSRTNHMKSFFWVEILFSIELSTTRPPHDPVPFHSDRYILTSEYKSLLVQSSRLIYPPDLSKEYDLW